jgi:hypothetical protein
MTTLTINAKTREAKAILTMLKEMPFVKIIDEGESTKKPSLQLTKAMVEAKNGKTVKCANVTDMMKKLNA